MDGVTVPEGAFALLPAHLRSPDHGHWCFWVHDPGLAAIGESDAIDLADDDPRIAPLLAHSDSAHIFPGDGRIVRWVGIVEAGELVVAVAAQRTSRPAPRTSCSVCTRPAAAVSGLARRACTAHHAAAVAQGAPAIVLEMYVGNDAGRRAYAALGFRRGGPVPIGPAAWREQAAMRVRAVLFDVGGVLSSEDAMPGHLVRAFTLPGAPDDIDHQIATGLLREQDFRTTLIEGGATEERADALMAEMWDWYCGVPDAALLEWAAVLRDRVCVAIISNSADGARREEERRYGFSAIFEPIVYSHEVGLAKPDQRIFALACELLGVLPHEAVFIDDRPVNVAAARASGMHAIRHTETATTVREVEALLGPGEQAPTPDTRPC